MWVGLGVGGKSLKISAQCGGSRLPHHITHCFGVPLVYGILAQHHQAACKTASVGGGVHIFLEDEIFIHYELCVCEL